MKYLFIILFTISCNAQIISLERRAECDIDPDNCPEFTYIKDINNSLDKYIGTWNATHNGKIYEFQFKKGLYQDLTLSEKKRDRLIGRLRITDSIGNILYNTFNQADDEKTNFFGLGFQSDLKDYITYFVGNSVGCAEYGDVYLKIQPSTPSQMTVIMIPDNDIVIEGKCPANFQPTIPYKQLIHLTKQ
ncbi:DUF6705 family protein [Chryseobacterium echinoideorum]|uniref:DUF6705 family protein n=1 Tax=Chryseobacterium echinoideorum TaxID=1549648 RepID=UPI0011856FEE|nr:DUF6705 family protein [Chryseobacterium echinoideorum]